ncbi:MAG: LpxI family protein [Desulfovibrionales bacterium]
MVDSGIPPSLGIIAGQGQFPFLVARGAVKRGVTVVAAGFQGHTSPELEHAVSAFSMLKLGQLEKLISFFRRHGVRDVVFAGSIEKPRALDIRPDFRAFKLLMKIKSTNDGALLNGVAGELTKEGVRIVSPLMFVPELTMGEGVLGKRGPTASEQEDIAFGWAVGKELGRLDIGQTLVVKDRMVVAVEALEGTDATLKRAGELLGGKGGVVIKIFKPDQDSRIDQPAVGVTTIGVMRAAGLSCLAAEAGQGLFFDREASLKLADEAGICVIGVKGEFVRF